MDDRHFINETLINKINIGIVYFDASGIPIYANKAADRIFGLTIDKFNHIGSPEHGFEIIDYDGKLIPVEENPIEIVKRTKKPVTDIIAGVHNKKTRHTTWILFEAEPEFAADGVTLERILTTVTNISSQISIEKKLRFQNKLQSLMMKTAKTYLGVLQDDPTAAILESLEEIGRFTETDRVYIFNYDFEHQLLSNTYEWCNEGITAHKDDMQLIPFEIAKDWVEEHSKGLSVHIPDVSALPANTTLKNGLELQGIQSCITVPIMQGSKCLGFVGLDAVKKKHFFTSQEQNLLFVFAETLVNMQVRQTYNKQIKESERKYREITENIADLIWTADIDFKMNYCSPSIESIFGYESEEYISGSINDQFSEETVEKYREIVREFKSKLKDGSISTQDRWNLEGQAIKKNGQVFWFKSLIKPSWNSENNITGVLGITRDITIEKRALVELQESEERLQRIVNSPTHYVLRTDLTGMHTYWNKTFEKEFGWLYKSKGLEKGDSLTSICNYHHKRTQEVVMACIRSPGTVHQIELDKPTREGGIMTTLWEFVCLTDVNGKPSEMQCMGIDISEKRIAEEQVRKLSRAVEQIPLTVVITNLEGNIEYANPYTFQTTGYTQEELLGKNPKVLKSGETSLEEYEHLWGNITHGKEWKGFFHNRKKDGSMYWEQATIGPILNENGEITHYIAIKEDITERKRIQDELKDLNLHLEEKIKERTIDIENANISLINANQEAQKANQAKIDFLSKMSHELRTPMNSILGFGQLLQMSELTPIQEKGVHHILDSGKHLLNLINEVLDISRIESGRISISVEPIEVYDVINEIKDSLQFSANQKNISINCQLKNTVPTYVKADRQRLKQVLINLTNNAIKYNNEGGEVNIVVDTKPTTEEGYTPIRISIIDNGWGIEEKDLERIFIPFERIGAEKTNVEGTGLGLAVVKQLIDIMGGKVGVKSKPGEGSTFWIELQQCQNQLDIIQEEATLNQHAVIHDQTGTVLYIEDNMPNIELVKEIMETKRKGISLVIHMHGNGALEKAVEVKPTLILLDLNLPDKHGKDILVELKENDTTKNIPVIVISADAMPNQISNLKALGAKNYLTKPIEIKSFLAAIDDIIK
ncbi:PAS domain S-box protein [Sediminibacterium sp.]|uniref:PAS domain S-box protein n=1 Tax=Sediminibacterium sp. TaxID=1917865 RepID=UPI0027348321|nr:PAS domain S-box protein [Sediminibacterium sp.]MDP3394746.1 PAS domain S-box protein [Sediminibacterium sp.]MDP3568581.1 PAS domain S-box protein [Sediminibacterium sp.]